MAALSFPIAAQTSISRKHVSPNDVICSKMKFAFNHQGNATFRKLVRKYRTQYQSARREDKSKYISCIRTAILQEGGRFLKQGEGETLVYMNESQTNEKISHALRCCSQPSKKAKPPSPRKERSYEYFLQLQRKLLVYIKENDMDWVDSNLSEVFPEDIFPLSTPDPSKLARGVCERNISIDSDFIQLLSDLND